MLVNQAIWSLLGSNQLQGQCITAQLTTIQTRVRALLSLFRLLGGDEKIAVEVNKFFSNEVTSVSIERNRIVHDPLGIRNGRVVRIKITAEKQLDSSLSVDALKDAHKTRNAIRALIAKFYALRVRMMDSLPEAARRPTEPSDPRSPH